jgi:hypothetical protein
VSRRHGVVDVEDGPLYVRFDARERGPVNARFAREPSAIRLRE